MEKNYKKIFMIVGNGFDIDYITHGNINLNSSKPFNGFLNKKIDINSVKCELLKLNENSKKDGIINILKNIKKNQNDFDVIKKTIMDLHNKVEDLTSIHDFYHYNYGSSIYNDEFGITVQNLLHISPDRISRLMKSGKINRFQPILLWASKIECELRQFIVLIYTKYQQYLDNTSDNYNNRIFKSWKWYLWIKKNFNNLLGAYVFNYDILFERLLSSLSIKYRRIGLINEEEGFPILKDHGSIDFDSYVGDFNKRNLNTDEYININRLVNTDGTFSINREEELDKLRVYPDIVLPSQQSYQLDLNWVKKGLDYYKCISDKIDCFVIVGFSYWDVDQEEFNWLVDNLPEGKSIDFYVVNPDAYNKKLNNLKKFIESRHHNYFGVTSGVPW